MSRVGVLRLGAMLAAFLFLIGAFAAVPFWTASAQGKTIFGLVEECNASPPTFLGGVTVRLVDAHGVRPTLADATEVDGTYSFTPPTGSYILEFELGEHYDNETTPFRFDGSIDVRKDICLGKMPTRDASLSVLVVDSSSTQHLAEAVTFQRISVVNENTVTRFYTNVTGSFTQTARAPVVDSSYVVTYKNGSSPTRILNTPLDYIFFNLFNGTLQIDDTSVISDIRDYGTNGRWLNVTYSYSRTTAKLQYAPVRAGSYLVYKNAALWMAENTSWTLNIDTGVIRILGDFVFGTDELTVRYDSTGAVPGANVSLFEAARGQSVAEGTTNDSGYVSFTIWMATFELRVEKTGFQAFAANVDTNTVNATRVTLVTGIVVVGHALRAGTGVFVSKGLVGHLYNTNTAVSEFKKVISARVDGSQFIFYAEPLQQYRMIIDADGYTAFETTVSTPASGFYRQDATLTVSKNEVSRSDVIYTSSNWNQVTIYWNQTLRSDSSIAGLELADIRSVNLQIDFTLGNRNGILEPAERTAFQVWLQTRLASHMTTDEFLSVNGEIYNASGPYLVQPPNFAAEGSTAIWINTSTTYTSRTASGDPLPNSRDRYYVNLTMPNDSNTTVYRDQVVVVDLPPAYEMVSKTVRGSIETTGWTRVTVDAKEAPGNSEIDMVVQKSRNGTAAAMIEGPTGKFFVINGTKENYTAVVAVRTNISFSANQSIDPVGNIQDANFTWKFLNNTNPANRTYGISPSFNYTSFGRYQANLTIVEAGGNRTYRDFVIYVDDTAPVARIKHNKTSSQNANGTTFRINEDTPMRFDASASSDTMYPGGPTFPGQTQIPDTEGRRGYSWDFTGDGIADSFARNPPRGFETPGTFTVNLTITDWVGHESVNATITVIVNDTTKPSPNFIMLDPSNDWGAATTLTEGKEYVFNASTSSDNYDENENLTYAWHFPGPVENATGRLEAGHWFNGTGSAAWNITVKWTEFNLSYNVTLNVTDTGYGWGDPAKQNWQNRTVPVSVSVDTTKHPDLKYVAASLKIDPAQPEEGWLVNVSLMIENIDKRANATQVSVRLYERDASGNLVLLSETPEWRTVGWAPTTAGTINFATKVRIVFSVSFGVQGNKSLEVKFSDAQEPYTWVDGQNRVTGSVNVVLASWVIPVAIAVIAAIVIGGAVGFRLYSRWKSGELVFRRKEKKEKKKVEEPEEDEDEEPEEDTKGKRRL